MQKQGWKEATEGVVYGNAAAAFCTTLDRCPKEYAIPQSVIHPAGCDSPMSWRTIPPDRAPVAAGMGTGVGAGVGMGVCVGVGAGAPAACTQRLH